MKQIQSYIRSYIRRHTKGFLLYIGTGVAFLLLCWLYGIPFSYAGYAILVLTAAAGIAAAADFIQYYRKLESLREAQIRLQAEFPELPPPEDLVEWRYQEMLRQLYGRKLESESEYVIRRKEMLDYYSMWAHQIKTPMAAMYLLLQTLREQQLELTGQMDADACGQILSISRGLSSELFKTEQYVEMVLSYLRMEDMSNDLVLKSCPVEPIVRQAVRKYSQMFIAKRIHPVVGSLSGEILTDEKWISFVIEQLLSNAVKYTEQGNVFLQMEGQVLVIRDTGIGIHKEDIPRVFEKGFTGYNGRSDKKSTGIGLYLCRQILERLGHEIRIDSVPGEGTEVRIDFTRKVIDFKE